MYNKYTKNPEVDLFLSKNTLHHNHSTKRTSGYIESRSWVNLRVPIAQGRTRSATDGQPWASQDHKWAMAQQPKIEGNAIECDEEGQQLVGLHTLVAGTAPHILTGSNHIGKNRHAISRHIHVIKNSLRSGNPHTILGGSCKKNLQCAGASSGGSSQGHVQKIAGASLRAAHLQI